jgi:hypothetical protein
MIILPDSFYIPAAFLPQFYWSSFGVPNRKPVEIQEKPKRTFIENRNEYGWIWIPEPTKRRFVEALRDSGDGFYLPSL